MNSVGELTFWSGGGVFCERRVNLYFGREAEYFPVETMA